MKFKETQPICALNCISEADFCAKLDEPGSSRQFIAPEKLENRISGYLVSSELREEYERELQAWMDNGWSLPYIDEKFSPPNGLIPLMAVLQTNKYKVHPLMDYREQNTYGDTVMSAAHVCAEKQREWRQQDANVSILNLRKAYLQVRVEKSPWPYQTVMFKRKRYCLSRSGSA